MNHLDRGTASTNMPKHGNFNGNLDTGPGPQLLSVDSLVGNDVYNNSGDDLGGIKDIMLDMRNGRVAYAVLSFGGIFGMGEKLFAVPWSALKLDTKAKRFTLNASKEQLQNAPGFNKNNWPDMADHSWQKEINSYYGTKPYSGEEGI